MNALELLALARQDFQDRLDLVQDDQWTLPTPCTEWDVRALVNHVVAGNLMMVALLFGASTGEVRKTWRSDALGADPRGAFYSALDADSEGVEGKYYVWTDEQLAAVPCGYGTAENLLTRAKVAKGERVLITGASGNVGIALIQLARLRGADIIGRFSGNKIGVLLQDGDDATMRATAERFLHAVRDEVVATDNGAIAVSASSGGVSLPRHARNPVHQQAGKSHRGARPTGKASLSGPTPTRASSGRR